MQKRQKNKLLTISFCVILMIGIAFISNHYFISEIQAQDLRVDTTRNGVYKIITYAGVKTETVNMGEIKDTSEILQMNYWLLQGIKTLNSKVVLDSTGKELKRTEEYTIENYELISLIDSTAFYFDIKNQNPVPSETYSIKKGNRGVSIFVRTSDEANRKIYKIIGKNKSIIELCGKTSREGYVSYDTLFIDTNLTLAPFQVTALTEGRQIKGLMNKLKTREITDKQKSNISFSISFKVGLDKSEINLFNKLIELSHKKPLFKG